ncbi:MAG: DUF3040 domain-containing protein [Frankia sp.]
MPLSEHEQRLLEQIERALVQDDPKFANTVRTTNPRSYLVRRLWRGLLVFLLGLAALIVGVSLNKSPYTVILGVVGFALMLLAGVRAAADLKRISGRGGNNELATRRARRARGRRAPFTERLEERWRRRWEDRGGL